MTKTELYTALSAVVDTYYNFAPVGTELPYAVYTWTHPNNFPADGKTYQKVATIEISLYSVDPDTSLDDALDALGEFWTSTGSMEVSDGAYLTNYTMEVIDNG